MNRWSGSFRHGPFGPARSTPPSTTLHSRRARPDTDGVRGPTTALRAGLATVLLVAAAPSVAAQLPPLETTTTTEETTTTTTESTTTTTEATTTTTTAPPAGSLAISVPAAADGGTVSAGAGSLTIPFASVTVSDTRAGLGRSWIASVSTTGFATGGGATIPASDVAYASGPATASSGTALPVPGQPDPLVPVPLGAPVTAFSSTAGTGDTTVTWQPTVRVTLAPGTPAGSYSGRIVHSVA